MNLSGTLNVFRLLRDPALCLPHHTVSTFNHLPIPLSRAFTRPDGKAVDIRAVVLDKDNCFAVPHANEVHPEYKVILPALHLDKYRSTIYGQSSIHPTGLGKWLE